MPQRFGKYKKFFGLPKNSAIFVALFSGQINREKLWLSTFLPQIFPFPVSQKFHTAAKSAKKKPGKCVDFPRGELSSRRPRRIQTCHAAAAAEVAASAAAVPLTSAAAEWMPKSWKLARETTARLKKGQKTASKSTDLNRFSPAQSPIDGPREADSSPGKQNVPVSSSSGSNLPQKAGKWKIQRAPKLATALRGVKSRLAMFIVGLLERGETEWVISRWPYDLSGSALYVCLNWAKLAAEADRGHPGMQKMVCLAGLAGPADLRESSWAGEAWDTDTSFLFWGHSPLRELGTKAFRTWKTGLPTLNFYSCSNWAKMHFQ